MRVAWTYFRRWESIMMILRPMMMVMVVVMNDDDVDANDDEYC